MINVAPEICTKQSERPLTFLNPLNPPPYPSLYGQAEALKYRPSNTTLPGEKSNPAKGSRGGRREMFDLPQPKVPNILITGTPGVGKSSLAKAISEATPLTHIAVGKIVKVEGLVEGKDEKFDTLIPDEDRLLDHLDHDGGRQDPFRRWSPGDFITPGPQSNFHPLSDSTKF
ncbi:Adenylate kinase isoenzyme 6-like protein [Diplonema papillatum]|nr:Adenylate kinase isoenzyme 6-like protein [Diplonema papillatum]